MSSTSLIECKGCGAPLTPAPSASRATCTYCGATNEIASEAALKLADQLAGKIRVAPKLMTLDEIEEDIAERERARRSASRHAVIVTLVILGVVAAIGGLFVLLAA